MKLFRALIFILAIASCFAADFTMRAQTIDYYFSDEAFENWKYSQSANVQAVNNFEKYLLRHKVLGVFPTFEILRTASMAKECNQSGFEVPPPQLWPNIVDTLKFIKEKIKPTIGNLEAVSSYRNPVLNECAGGAKNSSHSQYFALDMLPKTQITREQLIHDMCLLHSKWGEKYQIGLGFYSYTRFHIDSRSYRRWGPDGRSKTSPCVEYDKFATKIPNEDGTIE